MISAPRIRAPAKATSEPRPDTIAGRTPFADRRGRRLGGTPAHRPATPVDAELLDRVVHRRVDRRADLVGLVEHAADGRDHDDGHQDEQSEHEQAGGEARLEPTAFEAPGNRLEDHGQDGREQQREHDLAHRGERRDDDRPSPRRTPRSSRPRCRSSERRSQPHVPLVVAGHLGHRTPTPTARPSRKGHETPPSG